MSARLLAGLLAAEHAAVFGYGVLGARLDDATRRTALTAYDVHRARRDQVAGLLRGLGETPPPAAAGYDVATPTRESALALAVRLEEGLSLRWRDLVGGTDDRTLRALAIGGLQETAVRAATWRVLVGSTAVTVALPGAG